MKKPTAQAGAGGSGGFCPDAKFAKQYPLVVEYLSTAKWEDGSARETSTVTLFLESGLVKASLNDRAMSRSLYATAESVEGALALLEGHLRDDDGDWRAWKGGQRKK